MIRGFGHALLQTREVAIKRWSPGMFLEVSEKRLRLIILFETKIIKTKLTFTTFEGDISPVISKTMYLYAIYIFETRTRNRISRYFSGDAQIGKSSHKCYNRI